MNTEQQFRRMRIARERILLAVEAWGPLAVFEHRALVRWMMRHDSFGVQLVKQALLEVGMDRCDVEDLFDRRHSVDCCCWRCIMRLQMEVAKAAAGRELSAAAFANSGPVVAEGLEPCAHRDMASIATPSSASPPAPPVGEHGGALQARPKADSGAPQPFLREGR